MRVTVVAGPQRVPAMRTGTVRVAWRVTNLGLISFFLSLLSGCDRADLTKEADEIPHPRSDLISYPTRNIRELSGVRQMPAVLERSSELLSMFMASASASTAGVLNGPVEDVFGLVSDVAVTSTGRVIVLDRRAGAMRLFDTRGRNLGSLGRPGRGPGEFVSPTRLTTDAEGRLFVGDVTRLISVFEARNDSYDFVGSWHVPGYPNDICAMHGLVYVNVARSDGGPPVIAYSPDGSPVFEFPNWYHSDHGFTQQEATRALLHCDFRSGTLTVATAAMLGDVRQFDHSGRPLWITRLVDFRPFRVWQTERGARYEAPSGGFDRFVGLFGLESDALSLQVQRGLRNEIGSDVAPRIETYILDLSTGVGGLATDLLPEIAAIGPSIVVTVTHSPFPQITIHEHCLFRFRIFRTNGPRLRVTPVSLLRQPPEVALG
jgi:hypothetical protein